MRKIILMMMAAGFITSCASHSGRVCGGRGGARCVENILKPKITPHTPIV